ncbi:OLC1v1038258C1 [Oldenlandia corymbosa var. corymbosa]|uniref:YTH domain-containing family protein n=1 Tax=Oldenlandia corymbosa var. corymbosa TaxID=529605 RepID=A0AAV1D0I1_OLDCO|nr:OLC1v1038258C1 [Oldenlandia corymbosa var. corymbosa]
MATISAPSDEAAELLQKLSLDSLDKPIQDSEPAKKASGVKYGVDIGGSQMNGFSKPFERTASPHPDFMNPSMFYNPTGYPSSTYYYGGFNGSSVNDWDHYGSSNGVDMSPGVYGDYQNSYGYAPYGTYSSPGGPDSALYGPQHFQYPISYFQPSSTGNGTYTPNGGVNSSQKDLSTPLAADSMQLSAGGASSKGNQGFAANVVSHSSNDLSKSSKSSYHNNRNVKSNDFYGWGGFPSVSSVNTSTFSYGHNYSPMTNQSLRPLPHLMGMQQSATGSGMDRAGFMNRMYPSSSRMYGQYPNTFRRGAGYYSNSRGWLTVDNKYRSKVRGSNFVLSGNESVNGLNEVNKGPRARGFKEQKDSESSTSVNEKSTEDDQTVCCTDREQYNRDDFPESHTGAKFFVIKSYSEDDVHKSIKYRVWTSTPNGNKKLDAAFKEAQAQEKCGGCPVFLLFSVNASGQFVGLAEMTGPVDFDKSLEHWQQDKWTGCFPVKWHFIKDVPNSMLRHIILENNENKPVTNSRDTQEVRLEQGNEIVKIIKGHSSRTCILDDFEFYEGREKAMQEKKAKQQQFNKQANDAVVVGAEKDGSISKPATHTSGSLSTPLTEDSAAPNAA